MTERDPGMRVSEAARAYLGPVLAQKKEVVGIRIGTKKAGCSGYEYTLEFAYDKKSTELSFEDHGITLLVDETLYWKFFKGGTEMDYQKKGVQSEIVFHNPNVGAHCGCGESFTLLDE